MHRPAPTWPRGTSRPRPPPRSTPRSTHPTRAHRCPARPGACAGGWGWRGTPPPCSALERGGLAVDRCAKWRRVSAHTHKAGQEAAGRSNHKPNLPTAAVGLSAAPPWWRSGGGGRPSAPQRPVKTMGGRARRHLPHLPVTPAAAPTCRRGSQRPRVVPIVAPPVRRYCPSDSARLHPRRVLSSRNHVAVTCGAAKIRC